MRRPPPIRRAAACAAVALFLAGCVDAPSSLSREGLVGTPTPFETVDKGPNSGYDVNQPTGIVIKSEGHWNEFWAKHKSLDRPPAAAPSIDFATQLVFVALYGETPSASYRIDIVEARAANGTYAVLYLTFKPGEGCAVVQELGTPFHIVSVGRIGDGSQVKWFSSQDRDPGC